jgi:hypothetical protein
MVTVRILSDHKNEDVKLPLVRPRVRWKDQMRKLHKREYGKNGHRYKWSTYGIIKNGEVCHKMTQPGNVYA